MTKYLTLASLLFLFVVLSPSAHAATTCTFTTSGTTMTLDTDCTTDETLLVPDGFTLDGAHNTITAMDPVSGHFTGAVVANAGATAHITRVIVDTMALSNVCDAGDDRLRGVMLEDASGSIMNVRVYNINQGASGCQEGNAIEVRSEPFDGSHPNTKTVEIANNQVYGYQKTGILVNGDVDVDVRHNTVGESATQYDLAANALQLGFGATGNVEHNDVKGNQWLGASDYAATAMLFYDADDLTVKNNEIRGNSDVGMYIFADNGNFTYNNVFDFGVDGPHGDYGIYNGGTGNVVTPNHVRGFATPYEPALALVNAPSSIIEVQPSE